MQSSRKQNKNFESNSNQLYLYSVDSQQQLPEGMWGKLPKPTDRWVALGDSGKEKLLSCDSVLTGWTLWSASILEMIRSSHEALQLMADCLQTFQAPVVEVTKWIFYPVKSRWYSSLLPGGWEKFMSRPCPLLVASPHFTCSDLKSPNVVHLVCAQWKWSCRLKLKNHSIQDLLQFVNWVMCC